MTTAATQSATIHSPASAPNVYTLDAIGPAVSDGRPHRFRKDILRVGRFYPNGRPWDVGSDTLRSIADSFHAAREAGNRIPLVWDHSNSARSNAGEVVDLSIEGDTLYAVVHAQDPDAKQRLGTVNNDVSVQVVQPWTDGRGNRYESMLTHVAIVNHPVMTDQGTFTEFSNRGSEMGRNRTVNMADEVAVEEPVAEEAVEETAEEGSADETMMPVADVIAILESALGVTFPPEVDTRKELKIALDAMTGSASSEAPAEAAAAPDAMEGMEVQQLSLPAARSALAATQRKLSSLVATQRAAAEASYRDRLSTLVAEGRVAARHTTGLLDAGKAASYSMSLLAPFGDDAPVLPTSAQSVRALATDAVPGPVAASEIKRHQNRIRARMGLSPEA